MYRIALFSHQEFKTVYGLIFKNIMPSFYLLGIAAKTDRKRERERERERETERRTLERVCVEAHRSYPHGPVQILGGKASLPKACSSNPMLR